MLVELGPAERDADNAGGLVEELDRPVPSMDPALATDS
jgi:hypothetical protein